MQDSAKKIALVTGANKGIGFEVARQLAASGCTVLLGARKQVLGEEAASKLRAEGLDVRWIAIDLEDPATITAAADHISGDFGRLEYSSTMLASRPKETAHLRSSSLPAIEREVRVNFLGTVAVTQAMLPLLRKGQSARIVNVSSGLGSITRHADPASPYAGYPYFGYSASKAALNMFTAQLAGELRGTQVKVNSAEPGYTATDLNQHRGTQTVAEGAAEAIRLALLPEDGPTGTFSGRNGVIAW